MHAHPLLVAAGCAALFTLTSTATGQTSTYSPPNAATVDGNGNNTIPFGVIDVGRYQQVHGDITKPNVLSSLWLRRDGRLSTRQMPARKLDAEVVMAAADFAKSTGTFVNNYVGPATTVIKRKMISFPDISTAPGNAPAPFTVQLKADAPYPLVPRPHWLWEIRIHNAPFLDAYFLDAHSYAEFGASRTVGPACTATGQSRPMSQQQFLRTVGWNQSMLAMWRSFNGPQASPAAVMIGPPQNAVRLPGLCAPVQVLQGSAVIGGRTDSVGAFFFPPIPGDWLTLPWNPTLKGAVIRAQTVGYDRGRATGLQLSLSHAVDTTIADIPTPPGPVQRYWARNPSDRNGATDSGEAPYGLVIRIDHR